MFIIRNTNTGQEGRPFNNPARFAWLDGAVGFNARPGAAHGGQKIYEIRHLTEGAGEKVSEGAAVYDTEQDAYTITRTLSDPELTVDQKAAFKAQVDAAAEACRLQYITPGDGQSMSYREKADEAKALAAAYADETAFLSSPPAVDSYPVLESEIGITGANAWQVANSVLTKYASWKAAEKIINSIRMQAKADVDAATTVGGAKAIIAALTWPSPT